MTRKHIFIAASFFAAFLFSTQTFSQSAPLPNFNRKQTYDVQHYKIATSFDRAKHEVYGDTTVTLTPLAANFSSVELDAAGLKFSKVTLDPAGTQLRYAAAGDKINIELDKPYGPSDTISIRLVYTATKPKKGVYFVDPLTESGNEQRSPQIWTQGEAEENRYWFPSFDFPSDKATTEQLITAEKQFTVIANGELLGKTQNDNGTVTWHYKMPVPHSSYLTSFVIGKYVKVEDRYKDIPLGFYVYPEREQLAHRAFDRTKDMIAAFEGMTGVAFPYNKYDQTTVSSFIFGGMENITATTMADSEIAMANVDLLRGNVEDLVSHELAHSWFGNLVTCRNWAELWLNEGFATFMEAVWREKRNGPADYRRKVNSDAESFMAGDSTMRPSYALYNRTAGNVDALFDRPTVTYNKGGAVVHTLRQQVGDATFWKAINLYLSRHKFGSVESTDLRAAMEEVSGQDLEWFFNQWVYGTGYPKLSVAPVWNPAKSTLTLTVTQTQPTGGLNTAAYRLPMAVNLEFGAVSRNFEAASVQDMDVSKRTQIFTYKLPRKPTKIQIDKSDKIPIKSVKVLPIR